MLRLSITGLTSPLLPRPAPAIRLRPRPLIRLRLRALAAGVASSLSPSARSLRLLEWGKVCEAVASFAGTAHGRDATKVSRSDPVGLGCHVSLPACCTTAAVGVGSDARCGAVCFVGAETTVGGGGREL